MLKHEKNEETKRLKWGYVRTIGVNVAEKQGSVKSLKTSTWRFHIKVLHQDKQVILG